MIRCSPSRSFTRASLKLILCLAATIASMPTQAAPSLGCGTTLYASVTLTADVVCAPGQPDGLIVGDHKVRIELNGYSILGSSVTSGFPTGIRSSGFEQIQIVGPGLITGFATPIDIEGGNNHLISDVDAIQEWGNPVSVRNASGVVIQNSRITRLEIASDAGYRATANRVIGNIIGTDPGGGGGGVSLRGCDTADNMVANNSIGADYAHAVSIYDGAHSNQVLKNKMALGQVFLLGASNNMIADNTFWLDSVTLTAVEMEWSWWAAPCTGGVLLPSDKNIVRGNQVHSGEYSIWIAGGSANRVTSNTFFGPTYSGLVFGPGASANDAQGNTYVHVPVVAYDYGSGNLWP
jgi:parallel beta-helix repeat protein